jgi:muramidase (phage lysozyme)
MSDSREWPFNSQDLLKIPFIFVPDGDPVPTEWLASHPDAIRIRARFVPAGTAGTPGGGAIQADLNEAMMQWLGRAAGDGGEPASQVDQVGGRVSPEARLTDVSAASGTGAGAGSLSEMSLDSALKSSLYRNGDDGAAPGSQLGLEARLAVWLAANAPGRGEGSPTGATLDSALMKFILGPYADPAAPGPQVDREPGETSPITWLADWRPSRSSSPTKLPDPIPSHASSEVHNVPAPSADSGIKKLRPAEMLKLARMRAMLRLIRWEENEFASDDEAYHARYGGHDPMSDADMINYVPKPEYFKDPDGKVRAHYPAGAYQIVRDTWNRASKKLGITDFTPINQDRIAISIIEERHAVGDIEVGNLQQAIRKLKDQWVSLPGGSQNHITMEDTKKKYRFLVNEELKRIKDDHDKTKP